MQDRTRSGRGTHDTDERHDALDIEVRPGTVPTSADRADRADHGTVDPLDEAPPTTPRGSLALTVVAFVLGALAFLPTGLTFLFGPVGMGCGLVAHLKGRRAGFGAAVVAAVGTVVGLSLRTLLDIY